MNKYYLLGLHRRSSMPNFVNFPAKIIDGVMLKWEYVSF